MLLSHAARRVGLVAVRGGGAQAQRSLASAAVEEAVVPSTPGTMGRYASALYASATKQGSLPAVTADVETMQKLQASSPALDELLRNPSLARSAKVDTLSTVVQHAGFSRTFSDFMMVVAENGRSGDTDKILSTFRDMVSVTHGEVTVKVTSTMPLTEWELGLLKKNLKLRFFSDDAELEIETAIDASLLGGFTVQIGDRFMDLSTRTELRKLTEVILGNE